MRKQKSKTFSQLGKNKKMTTECSPTNDWKDKEWNNFRDWIGSVLKTTEVTVSFYKKDGTERVMKCTLNPEVLPPIVVKEDKKERKIPEHSMAVYDVELKEWRSFVIKSVKHISFTLSQSETPTEILPVKPKAKRKPRTPKKTG
jgi:hypothetical protein